MEKSQIRFVPSNIIWNTSFLLFLRYGAGENVHRKYEGAKGIAQKFDFARKS